MSNNKNIILGINWEQNSTASLMINGKIIDVASEERFTKIKNDESYPKKAIDWLLKNNKLSKKDINYVSFISKVWSPTYPLIRHYTGFSIKDYIDEQKNIWFKKIYNKENVSFLKYFKKKIDLLQYPGKSFWKSNLKKIQNKSDHLSNKSLIKYGQEIRVKTVTKHLSIDRKKIKFVDHSEGHSSYAYFSGKLCNTKTLVLTLDAFGDFLNYTARVYSLNKNGNYEIKKIANGSNFIIGRLYRYVTLILGLKPNEHEYKVMGLAPYCKKKYYLNVLNIFRDFQKVNGVKFVDKKRPKDLYFGVKKLIETNRFDAVAGGLQAYSEELIVKWIENCIKKTGVKNVCLAGGVGLNVKANFLVSKIKNLNNFYVPPSPDDSSQGMGACYATYLKLFNENLLNSNKQKKLPKPSPLKNAYLGYEIKDEEVIATIKKFNLKKKYIIKNKNINLIAAKLISKGKIISRAVGKAEFGARALGNRSILADPSNVNVKRKINEKIKNRDFWMPFAATTNYLNCKNILIASFAELTMGFPCKLKDVFNKAYTFVSFPKLLIRFS